MNVKLGCVMLTVLLLGAGAATDAKKDTAKFQGTWTVDTLTYDGKDHKLKFNIVFKGNDGTVKNNEKVQNEYAKIKFKLDPSSKPRSMDITITDGSQTAWRTRTRPPSFIHFQVFPHIIKDHLIADIVAVLGSLNIIAAELDR